MNGALRPDPAEPGIEILMGITRRQRLLGDVLMADAAPGGSVYAVRLETARPVYPPHDPESLACRRKEYVAELREEVAPMLRRAIELGLVPTDPINPADGRSER